MTDDRVPPSNQYREAYEMTIFSRAWRYSLNVRPRVAAIAIAMVLFGFSVQGDVTSPIASRAPKPQPKLSLEVQAPAKRGDVKPGATLKVLCTVAGKPGGFEPVVALFEVSDPSFKGKGDSKLVLTSFGVREREKEGNTYTFYYEVKAPKKPGRYVIGAKVVGVDPSRPQFGPPEAPAADGTRAKPGARGEYDAPRLEIEVKAR